VEADLNRVPESGDKKILLAQEEELSELWSRAWRSLFPDRCSLFAFIRSLIAATMQ